jgi:hypothetical protein
MFKLQNNHLQSKLIFKLYLKQLLYSSVILALALYMRLRYVIYTPFEFKIDAWSMFNYALNVANGKYYGQCFGEHWARYAYWPPLYIFLSGFVYKFFGVSRNFLHMRLIQVVFSSVSCLLAAAVADETARSYSRCHREAGLIAGLLLALNKSMIAYTNHLYTETIFITIYLGIIYTGLKYIKYELYTIQYSKLKQQTGVTRLLAFAVLLGIGNLTRPVLLLLPVAFLFFALLYFRSSPAVREGDKRIIKTLLLHTAFIYAVMLLVMSPWTIRNFAATGRLILVDTNGPIKFLHSS